MSGAKISVEGVSHAFEDRPVLRNVGLDAGAHEFVCIVGPSGCGKTTLLRIMAGLLPAQSGRVLIDGEPVRAPSARTAMVFQHFGLFPWLTVRDNIAYGLRRRGRGDLEGVGQLMELTGLADSARLYPRQLSGGMRQRVGLARALAVEPEVLLMDEPFGALDAITREQLQGELLRIWDRDRDVCGIFITHDIDEAILLGDRIVVMAAGPGRVVRTLEVPFARPREGDRVRRDPAHADLRRQVWEAMGTEAAAWGS